jgi:hypothetical protein
MIAFGEMFTQVGHQLIQRIGGEDGSEAAEETTG